MRNKGAWSKNELRALRRGILKMAGNAVPLRNVPWVLVAKHVGTRSPQQCRLLWSNKILPELLEYRADNGILIEPDVFSRALIRKLALLRVDHETDVDWDSVNTWWPANVNEYKWWQLQMTLPDHLLLHAPFLDQVKWCHKALQCKKLVKRDEDLLLGAKLVEDMQPDDGTSSDEEPIVAAKSVRTKRPRRKARTKQARAKRSIRSSIDAAGT